ncbi:hypothetical protein BJV78DRAFT_279549 [Lactifluus subvellereus]|nr:hypothetical protein BJV78DRAFT_279549 [Lactifluus subvellereus]
MATGLSGLTRLESLTFEYEYPWSFPHQRSGHPPPVTRVIVPALTEFKFRGVSGYLEDLVAQIDAPLLTNFQIMFPNEFFFYTPQLPQFIGRMEKLGPPDFARVTFCRKSQGIEMTLSGKSQGRLKLYISGTIESMMQICKQSLRPLSTVKTLHIWNEGYGVGLRDDFDWVEFCRPLEKVGMSNDVGRLAWDALAGLAWGRNKHVLPALNDVWMERGWI